MHSEVVRHGLTVKLSLPLLRRRRNFTHEVNFTIADNFTCPKGKLSFSVFSVKDNTLTPLPFFLLLLCFGLGLKLAQADRLIDGCGKGDSLTCGVKTNLLIKGVEHVILYRAVNDDHNDFFFGLNCNVKMLFCFGGRSTSCVDHGTAPCTAFSCRVHRSIGEACVNYTKYHFVCKFFHFCFSLSVIAKKLVNRNSDNARHRNGEGDTLAVFNLFKLFVKEAEYRVLLILSYHRKNHAFI